MEAIIQNLIKAIGWSILHSLWQGALVYTLLFIIFSAFPKANAKTRHNIAFGSLLLIFIGFCITFLCLFKLPIEGPKANDIGLSNEGYLLLQKVNSYGFKTETYFPYLVGLYSLGIIFQLMIILKGYFGLKTLKKAQTLAIPNHWETTFKQTLAQLNIKKRVKFYLSAKVNVPLIIGFFKPVVLFPLALVNQLDLQQVEAILIHELSHIRRNDYLVNLVKIGIETLLFFNPFVWLTSKFVQIEREHACDDLVLRFTNTPLTYAHALLKLELIKDKHTPNLSLAATGANQHLYQRIKRITNMKTNYINIKQQFLIVALSITAICSLAWITPSKEETKKARKEKSLSIIKTSTTEINGAPKIFTAKADIDTLKKKKKTFKLITTNEKGDTIVYNSLNELPDSLKLKIETLEKKLNSPEWKEKMTKLDFHALDLSKKFDSKEWKDKMAINLKNMEFDNLFDRVEWKNKLSKIEFNGESIEKILNSQEWKDKIDLKKFDSKEWKERVIEIEKKNLELHKKINSSEWMKKVEDLKKLQSSPEYKELREKYERDLEELKKKKGISTDKTFLLFENGQHISKVFLPKTEKTNVLAAVSDHLLTYNTQKDKLIIKNTPQILLKDEEAPLKIVVNPSNQAIEIVLNK